MRYPRNALILDASARREQVLSQDPRYAEHVKYLWLTADDGSNVKVYDQKRPVEYADYMPGMLYVSVYEVFPTKTTK